MIIDIDFFNQYTSDYETSTENLKLSCIASAQDIVEQYVKYKVESNNISKKFTNVYENYIFVSSPVISITTLKINDEIIDNAEITIENNFYIKINGYEYYKGLKVEIDFEGGFNPVPDVFKLATAKIATLLFLESNKNIGITGLVNPDGMSRTFINYNNYNKHLRILNKYKVL